MIVRRIVTLSVELINERDIVAKPGEWFVIIGVVRHRKISCG